MVVLSLGGGVQSTALALMAAHGEITPMPDMAIFADTGWESQSTLRHVRWLEGQLPYPIHTVQAINLRDVLMGKGHFISPPAFVLKGGEKQMVNRQCTKETKIVPIRRKLRVVMKEQGVKRVVLWVGISLDEVSRMKASDVKYIENQWPLIDNRITRAGCVEWLERNGYPIPDKSSCVGCPFHSDRQWTRLRDLFPDEFTDAVAVDAALRHTAKTKFPMFLHPSCKPLGEVRFRDEQQEGFLNECTGFCGI